MVNRLKYLRKIQIENDTIENDTIENEEVWLMNEAEDNSNEVADLSLSFKNLET